MFYFCSGELNDLKINDTNDAGATALMLAAHKGHDKIVRELLKHPRIDANLQTHLSGFNALMFACHDGHEQVVYALLHYESNPFQN